MPVLMPGRVHAARLFVVLAFSAMAVFGAATVASAATSFGTPVPAVVGPRTSLSMVELKVDAKDPVGIKAAAMKVDGVAKTPYVAYAGHWETDGCSTWFVPDYTQATVGFRMPMLAVGSHAVTVTVTNNSNQVATKAWTIDVQPAQAGFTLKSPAPGSTVSAWDVPVSVVASDPAGINDGPQLTIDGVVHPVTLQYAYGTGWVTYDEWNFWSYNFYPGPGPLDMTRAFATFTPGMLADGPHTASITLIDGTGRSASTSWSFTVAAPPRISQLAPADGGSASTRTPTISAHVTDNGRVAATSMAVDGVAVTPVFDAASGTLSYTPSAPLANDRVHTVTATATDAGGLTATAAWSFTVQIYADMPQPGTCTDCHDATKHPMSDCAACHNVIYIGHGLGGPISWCLTCHHTSGHGPETIIPGVTWGGGDEPQPGYTGYWGNYCDYCHSPKYPTVPRHAADNAALHMTTTDMTSCNGCHTRELTREHFRYKNAVGAALDCWTCHGDAAPANVKAAIAAGNTACDACHANASHEALHAIAPRTDDCARCHPGDSLTVLHAKVGCGVCHAASDPAVTAAVAAGQKACSACHASASHEALHSVAPRTDTCVTCHSGDSLTTIHPTCELCHSSTDPKVVAAVLTGNKACSACHVTQGIDYHLNMAKAHIAPVSYYYSCGHCHHGWSSNPMQGPNITRHAGGCTLCHNATTDLTGKTSACDSCHKTEGVDFHPNTGTYHTPTDAASLACAECHKTTDVRTLHTTLGCQTCHATYGCSECHSMHMGGGYPLKGTECSGCHVTAGTDYHANMTASHAYPADRADCLASGCHDASATVPFAGKDVTAIHANATTTTPDGKTYSSCKICHSLVFSATLTTECLTCHADRANAHGYDAALHTASATCVGTCHAATAGSLELKPLHDAALGAPMACGACHPTKVDAVKPWDKTCTACHPIAGLHAAAAASHVGTDTAYRDASLLGNGCTAEAGHTNMLACHTIDNIATVHSKMSNNGCDVCHGTGKTPSRECLDCHQPGDSTQYLKPGSLASATATFYPESDVSITSGWTVTTTPAGQARYAVVNTPYPPADVSRYVTVTTSTAGGMLFGYNAAASPIPANATIVQVQVYAKAKATNTTYPRKMQGLWKVGGATYQTGNQSGNLPSTGWLGGTGAGQGMASSPILGYDYTFDMYGMAIYGNPRTGQRWTPQQLMGTDPSGNNLEAFGVALTGSAAANNVSLSQIYLKVFYYVQDPAVAYPTVGTHTYHQDNVKYLHDPADAGGKRFALSPAHGWYDALFSQDCYDICHRGYARGPAFSAEQGQWMWYSIAGDAADPITQARYLTLKPIAVPTASPQLTFMTQYGFDATDVGKVEVSTDGGTSWTALTGTVGGAATSSLTGSSGGWVAAAYDLSAYAGQTVKLRFSAGGASNATLGWGLDEIGISGDGTTVFSDDAETLKPDWTNTWWTRSMGAFPHM